MKPKHYITKEGAEKLRLELHELLKVERPKLVETVAWAAGNGDRSENADYIYGKRRLRQIDSRIKFLTDRLESATVVDISTIQSEKIVFGATVNIEDDDGKVHTYQIVGEEEIDLKIGRISWRSPMGQALLGKQVDDDITVQSPSGEREFVVIKITY